MKRRTVTLLSLLGLLAGLGVVVLVLVYTPVGVGLLQARMDTLLPGVTTERMDGTLGGGFRVHGLRYENERISLRIAQAQATPRVFGSLGGVIGIAALDAQGVRLVVKPQGGTDGEPVPPLPAIDADAMRIRDVAVTMADGQVLKLDSIAGGFASRGTTVSLRRLQVRGPGARIDGDVAFDVNDLLPRSGSLRLDLTWEQQRYAGALQALPRGTEVESTITLDAPLRGSVALRYPGRDPASRWSAMVNVPEQRAEALPEALREQPFALQITLKGEGGKVAVAGDATLAGRTLRIDGGRIAVEPTQLRLEQLVVQEKGRPGRISATGVVPRDDGAVALEIALDAVDPQWQGSESRIDGTVSVGGTWAGLALRPKLRLSLPGKPAADISGSVRITDEGFMLEPLEAAVEGGGTLDVRGTVPREDAAPWTLQVDARQFDPGALLEGFDGKLDAQLELALSGSGDAFAGSVSIASLQGELRGRAVSAQGTMGFAHGTVVSADLQARSGSAELAVSGDDAAGRPLQARLSAPALSDLAPGWQGSAEASVTRVDAQLHDFSLELAKARLDGVAVETLQASGRFDLATRMPLAATLAASGIDVGGRHVDEASANLTVQGDALHGELDARAGESTLALSVRGKRVEEVWSGVVERLEIAARAPAAADPGAARDAHSVVATLSGEAPWRRDDASWSIGPLCLTAEGGRACLEATQSEAAGSADGSFERLPIAPFVALWDPGLASLSGEVSGTALVRWSGSQLSSARIDLRSEQGRVALPERADVEFGYHALALVVDWSAQGGSASLSAALDPTGRIDGKVSCSGTSATGCALQGQIDARIDDLAWVEALSPELMDTQGRAQGRLRLTGTPAAPLLSGRIRVEDFVGYVPRLALKLQRGEFTAEATQERSLTLDGAVWSGDARLHLGGTIDPGRPEATVLKLSGENVLISNTPDTRVRATPDLELRRRDAEWQLTGRIVVPEARIDVSDRETATVRSNDVVVVDDPPRDPRTEQPWNANITVELGDDVRVEGLGFDGKLSGELGIRQRRDSEAVATGQIVVTGRYEAYGQRLDIGRGRLLYAGAPLDNPALNIRAERKLRDAVAGVDVSGTAQQPEMQVYSRPAMSESEALALLVTGRPLREVRSSERGKLGTAAVALGTVGGDLLAQSVGGPLGLDEIGIGEGAGFDGAALSFGKYLSPRLFVGYGIGLLTRGEVFTVRFKLTDKVELEAQSGQETRAALNYRIER